MLYNLYLKKIKTTRYPNYICDKVCQWLTTGRWFSPDTPVSSTNKTDHHDIIEILLKVAFNTINPTRTIFVTKQYPFIDRKNVFLS